MFAIWIGFLCAGYLIRVDGATDLCSLPFQKNREFVNVKCESEDESFTLANVTETETVLDSCTLTIECRSLFSDKYSQKYEFSCRKGAWYPDKPLCQSCGIPYIKLTPLISRGDKAIYGELPWHVAIFDKGKKNNLICGGTIISEYIVVSAAHCFYDLHKLLKLNETRYEVVVGKFTRDYATKDNPAQEAFQIKEIRISDGGFFGAQSNYAADIALLILDRKLKFGNEILPACVDWVSQDFNPLENQFGKVTGWGWNENSVLTNDLLVTTMHFISNPSCLANVTLQEKKSITLDKFCAINKTGSNVRKGDSGGGLVFRDSSDSAYYLRGIISVSITSSPSVNVPALFTDISKYVNWIRKVKKEVECEILNITMDSCSLDNCPIPEQTISRYSEIPKCNRINTTSIGDSKEVPESCKVQIKCRKGYAFKKRKSSAITSICEDAEWIPPIKDCQKACAKLESADVAFSCFIDNDPISCDAEYFPAGTRIEPKCEDWNFHPDIVNYTEIVCTEKGEWNNPLFRCLKDACVRPKEFGSYAYSNIVCENNNRTVDCRRNIQAATKMKFSCSPGYTLNTEHDTITCSDESWSHSVPECVKGIPGFCHLPVVYDKRYSNITCEDHIKKEICNEKVPIGTKVRLSCARNFHLDRDYNTTSCKSQNQWERPLPRCEEDLCPRLDQSAYQNMKLICEEEEGAEKKCETLITYGTRIKVSCAPGYSVDGILETNHLDTLLCDEDGHWSAPIFKCVKDKCTRFNFDHVNATCKLKGSVINCSNSVVVGTEVTLHCNPNHPNQISSQKYSTVCQKNGTWSAAPAKCIATNKCKNIPLKGTDKDSKVFCAKDKKKINCTQRDFDPGTRISVKCVSGYRPTGIRDGTFYKNATRSTVFPLSFSTECQPNGQWTRKIPIITSCARGECAKFSEYPEHNGVLNVTCKRDNKKVNCSDAMLVGTELKLSCMFGSKLNPKQKNDTVVCQPNSLWSSEVYGCEKVVGTCALPMVYDKRYQSVMCKYNNVEHKCKDAVIPDTEISVSCVDGFYLDQNYNRVVCGANSTWSLPIPVCGKDYCLRPNLTKYENMNFTCDDEGIEKKCETQIAYGRRIKPSCVRGYFPNTVLQTDSIICDSDQKWTAPMFICSKDRCTRFSFSNLNATCRLRGTDVNCDNDIVAGMEVSLPCAPDRTHGNDVTKYVTVCQEHSTWSVPTTKCVTATGRCKKITFRHMSQDSELTCKSDDKNINCSQVAFDVGTQVIAKCIPGYRPANIRVDSFHKNATRNAIFPLFYSAECQPNGQWTRKIPEISSCVRDECERFSEYPEHKDTLKIKCFQHGREVDCSENIVVGTVIKLGCAPGTTLHRKQENDTLICQPNSQWSSKIYSCVKIECEFKALFDKQYSRVECKFNGTRVNCSSLMPLSTKVRVSCLPGERMDRVYDEVKCESDGHWDSPVPQCRKDYCHRFNLIAYQNMVFAPNQWKNSIDYETSIQYGRILGMSCAPGYWPGPFLAVNAMNETRCDYDTLWTSPVFECVKDKCSRFEFENLNATCRLNGRETNCNESIVAGLEVTLPCELENENQITSRKYSTVCQENGTWSTSIADDCVPITGNCKKIAFQNTDNHSITICKRRGEDVNCEQEEFYAGTEITVRCTPGYRPTEIREGNFHKNATRWTIFPVSFSTECQPNGQWTRKIPEIRSCAKDECERIFNYPNYKGVLNTACRYQGKDINCAETFFVGTEVKLSCSTGYNMFELQKNTTVVCETSADWSSKIYGCYKGVPECPGFGVTTRRYLDVSCTHKGNPLDCNGVFPLNGTIKFTCHPGYKLDTDHDTMKCIAAGAWNANWPMCELDTRKNTTGTELQKPPKSNYVDASRSSCLLCKSRNTSHVLSLVCAVILSLVAQIHWFGLR